MTTKTRVKTADKQRKDGKVDCLSGAKGHDGRTGGEADEQPR